MQRPMLVVLALTLSGGLGAGEKPIDVPISKLGSEYRLVGKLHEPLGTVLTLQGVVVEGRSKGHESGPNLRVQRINGKSTQEDIHICLTAYFTKFGGPGEALPKLEFGQTYEFEGYETGGFVGVPDDAYTRAGFGEQTSGHHFRHEFRTYKGKTIDPIGWAPADFVDREALLEGKAFSRDRRSYIVGGGWELLVDASAPWPKPSEGKKVEAMGTVRKEAGKYSMTKATTRLVKLADQLGKPVELRGRAWSMNSEWWFDYRGTDMYVEGMKDLPGWDHNLHGQPVLICGTLEEAMLPTIDQITLKPDRDKKKYYIVRKPTLKRLDALLAPEID